MPGLDRKGPEGKGPRTGRGLGRCNDKQNINVNEEQEEFPGRGMAYSRGFGGGRGGGRGRGMGRGPGRGRGFGRASQEESEE